MESLDQRLVSTWSHDHSSVPLSYVQPLESRPGSKVTNHNSCKTIPVIDLGGHNDRAHTTKQILKASEDYGFFQVINHRVSKDLMDEALNIFKEFHAMPPKEKVNECSKDPNGRCKLYTSSENYKIDAVQYWKDTLSHPCPSSGDHMKYWPEKPTKYREVVGKYTQELRKLALEILELFCEGLGLNPRYFCGGLSGSPHVLVHHYPPCPEPSLTLGLAKHRDPTVITILLQDQLVQGLQVLKDGEWLGVEPLPNAFVVNIGLLLQIISNGRLVGAEHRVVTNLTTARTSVAYFIYPSMESIIEPAQCLMNETTLPVYKSMTFGEFRRQFFEKGPKIEEELQARPQKRAKKHTTVHQTQDQEDKSSF
ncbi:hyoscyamine 6-dioxygenase-like isoform X2 [Lotus japonicus]|uniref:hyoscyamine 6-dioxygenase-like isoform X2 n=1 Tax=Lotus japonicus TaxID=34305 RepID=UPI0025860E76|nr:hyoscyamine 6-dioxygenase-like isoform X2 [Lotus japonicus]XP_057447755.1 hyoscyamine 6-dioxygenase-like isoform X2 [Lotus japonicus]